jgi:quinol monooxygenase YgiN
LSKFAMHGKVRAQPGKRTALLELLLEAAEILGQMPECRLYVVSTSDEPDAVWVTELWDSEEAHARSLERQDVRALIREGRPLIAGMSDRVRLTPVGGKGL